MRLRADLFDHVELPDDVGVFWAGKLFLFIRPIVLVVTKALRIETDKFATVRNIIKLVAFDKRRRADALKRPIVYATGSEFFIGMLPEKFSV